MGGFKFGNGAGRAFSLRALALKLLFLKESGISGLWNCISEQEKDIFLNLQNPGMDLGMVWPLKGGKSGIDQALRCRKKNPWAAGSGVWEELGLSIGVLFQLIPNGSMAALPQPHLSLRIPLPKDFLWI